MILTRYILKEHIGPFIFAILVITFIFLLNIIFRDLGRILSRGIDIITIFEFLALNLAWIIALAVPMGVLIATLTTFGRLSADNEVTAIKSSGISFYQLIFPVLVASTILGIALVVYNNSVLPHFNHRARLLMEDILRKRPTLKLEPNVVFTDIPNMNLLTKSIVEQGDSSFLQTVIIDDLSDKKTKTTILAKTGKLKFDKRSDRLFLDLYNGEIHEIGLEDYSKYRELRFEHYRINVEIPGLSLKRSESGYRGDREKSTKEMKHEIENYLKVIAQRKEHIRSLISTQFAASFDTTIIRKALQTDPANEHKLESDGVFSDNRKQNISANQAQMIQHKIERMQNQIKSEQRIIKTYSQSIDKLLVEIHKKYSIPVACIVFVLIGAPLGILTRKGNMGVAAGISLLFYLLYWIFLIAGEGLGDRQLVSPIWAMWAPNIVIGIFGVWLVLFTVREFKPINWEKLKPKTFRRYDTYEQN